MRQYNVSWTQIYELLVQMSVVVGTGNPYSWSISADQQWLQVFLEDDPTNPNITIVTVDLAPVIPDTPLTPPPAITVTAVEPTTVAITDEDVMLIVTGTQFNPTTQVLLGGVAQETIAVSSMEVATVFDPQSAPGFGAFEVQVQDGTQVIPPSPSPVTFTVTSATKVTGATAGLPGIWTPVGNTRPWNLSALTAATPAITASPATAWGSGQHVILGDATLTHWNGTAWVAGAAAATVLAASEAPPQPMPASPAEDPTAPQEVPV